MTAVDVDLLIVGAGPVGLFGAYYAGVRGLRTAVIDSLSQVGGQVTAMYPEKQIFDIAGFPAVSGRALINNLVEQAAPYHPVYLLGQEAQRLERVTPAEGQPDLLVVGTSSGTQITTRAIVITGGIGTFTPRPLPAGEEFLGRGLEYFVPSSAEYTGKDVVVVGGGDSAVDWALMLHPIARSVTVVHRRAAFRAHQGSLEQLRACPVEIIINAQVTTATGNGHLESVEVAVAGADPRRLPCQKLVAALGFTANLGPLREWGLALHDNRHLVVDSAMRTNLDGIYAAGDITDYDGKIRLIAVGFGEVATAVNNAAVHINPDAQLFPGHSTDNPTSVPQPATA
jgi:ferredoxin/flavodoxin---NADP+ reductase